MTKETKEPIAESNQDKVRKKIETTILSRGGQVSRVELYGSYNIIRWTEALGVTVQLTKEALAEGKQLPDALTYSNYVDLHSAREAINAVDPFKDTKRHARESITIYDIRGDQFSNAQYEGL